MGRVSRGDPGRGKGGWIGGREGGKSEKWTVWEPIRLGLVFLYFMIAGIQGNFARVGGTREVQLAYWVEGCFDLGCLLGTLLSCTTVSARRRGPLEGESGRMR